MGGEDGCVGRLVRPLSELVSKMGLGNFLFVREKLGNFRNLHCGNHVEYFEVTQE